MLSTALLLLALAGAYRPWPLRVTVGAFGLLAGLAATRAWRERITKRGHRALFRTIPAAWLWAGITVGAIGVAFFTALAPEVEYDALWYHLELPRRWLAAGTPVDDVHEYVALYPLTWELLYGAALAFDGSSAARLLHWSALAAGAVTAGSFSTRALGATSGWIAAAIFVTAPTVLWEGTTAYVDLALALHAAIGAGALWQSTEDDDRRWLALAGIQLGLAYVTKHLGLVIAAIAIGTYAASRLRGARPAALGRALILVSAMTVLVPSPWYVRAWMASGNPGFPEMYGVFGASPPERWDDLTERGVARFKDRFGSRTPAALLGLPWDMTMHGARYGGTLGLLLLLVVPGLAAASRSRRAARWLLGAAAVYLLVWASPLASMQARFLVPWWLFVSAAVGSAIVLLADTARGLSRAGPALVHGILAAVAFVNLPPFTVLHERDRRGWSGWLTHVVHRIPVEAVLGGESEEAWLRSRIRSYGRVAVSQRACATRARVLTFLGGDPFYAGRLWSEAVAARPATWGATEGGRRAVLEALDDLGITYVIVPRRPPDRTDAHEELVLLRAASRRPDAAAPPRSSPEAAE